MNSGSTCVSCIGAQTTHMEYKKFLQHEVSREKISGNRGGYQSFARYFVKYDKGKLETSHIKRKRGSVYPEV